MPPTSKFPLKPGSDSGRSSRLLSLRTLRVAAAGLLIGMTAPVFADNLPDVQRLIKQGQYPQALEKVDAYLASRPKDAQGRFLKGLIYTEMNRAGDAIAVFTKLTEDYPELPEPYNNLAVLHAQQKQYDKARSALEMAIRTHPSYAIAYENLGDIYAKLASQAYDKALQLDSANSATQNKLALIRDLITTSGRGNVKPSAAPSSAPAASTASATPAAKPAVASPPAPAATLPPPPPPVVAAKPSLTPATPAVAPATATGTTAKPSAESAGSKPDPAIEDINKALAAWSGAWMRKEMKAYFAAYASDFETPKGMSRKAWEEEREQRIAGKGGKISVSYDTPKITIEGNQATVKLRQHYKAPGISTSASKVMIFVRSGGKWLIKEEKSR
ncbi:tetratricopeptide repeat protein [Dechloromonas sp. ZY10]|uniref:tetratricopeptide repeat protein n=1 Tax=Dechloromonas aquae TaxID=2664436 RepID=UPI00352745FA